VATYVLKTKRAKTRAIDYEKELNPQQLEVVMAEENPILVIAGAGSGKTRTVTYRVARLVETGIDPFRILLVTFTNKAAREMLRRVEGLLDIPTRALWGGTFHHIGNLVLRKHAKLLGYKDNYTILDREDAKDLISSVVAEMNIDTISKRFPLPDVIEAILNLSANTGRKIEDIIIERYQYFWDQAEAILAIAPKYRDKKKRLNAMDFDDLLLNWKSLLLGHPEVAQEYSERFQHILVDEYQDTNKLQAEIVDILAQGHRNVMVVGDDSQSIYSFRGANFENIIEFPKRYPDAKIFRLEINYRSTPEILKLANSSISNNERQFPKSLRAMRTGGEMPALVPLKDEIMQAEFAAQRILELRDQGVPLKEIAVLYRAHYQSMELQLELTRRDIPFEVRSGLRFFEQAHIKDVVSFLRLMCNTSDEIAWKRALKLFKGIGPATADAIWTLVSSSDDPLRTIFTEDALTIVPSRGRAGWSKFLNTIQTLTKEELEGAPSPMIEAVLLGGYMEYLQERWPDYENRAEDLEQLKNYSVRFANLETFLSELALLRNVVGEDVVEAEVDEERLILSTIHQAKGLEWSYVFLISLCEGKFPASKSLNDPKGEEEERRLFYVAVTRARDGLYLCYPYFTIQRGTGIIQRPSRFIKELPEGSFERWDIE